MTATFVRLRTLTVSLTGGGTGSVTIQPGGIVCTSTCSATFDDSTQVTLTASPAAGEVFTGWSEDCSGTAPCVLTMDADKSVTATFITPPRTLTVTKAGDGEGIVVSNPAGIDCGTTCSTQYGDGTVVILSASPSPGSTFEGWSGVCAGTATCVLTMLADRSVTATFTSSSSQQQTLLVSTAGTGSGTVTSDPAGINCPSQCSAGFNPGTVVILTATPLSGHTFAGWSGDCTGTGTCALTMSTGHSVTATFTAPPPPPPPPPPSASASASADLDGDDGRGPARAR